MILFLRRFIRYVVFMSITFPVACFSGEIAIPDSILSYMLPPTTSDAKNILNSIEQNGPSGCPAPAVAPEVCSNEANLNEVGVEVLLFGPPAAYRLDRSGMSLSLPSFRVDSVSTLDVHIAGKIRYNGALYAFIDNGGDAVIDVDLPSFGTKSEIIITAALVDIASGLEVGNTTILEEECQPAYDIQLGLGFIGNVCNFISEPTYSFNTKVIPGHKYKIELATTCQVMTGGPQKSIVGCKFAPEWEDLPSNDLLTVISLLGPIASYTTLFTNIGRPGGVKWDYSTVTFGSDIGAQLIALQSNVNNNVMINGDKIENVNNNVINNGDKIENVNNNVVNNGDKIENVNSNVINNGDNTEEVIRLVKLPQGQRKK